MTEHHLDEDLAAMADDGRGLSRERKAELERHVADCAHCRAALASARLVLSTVDAQKPLEPSEAFNRALFARLDALDQAGKKTFSERLRELFTLPRVGIAMAAAASIAVAVVVYRPSDDVAVAPTSDVEELAIADD